MKPEILLKAYVQYQSEDAFRDLVAGTVDEVYSTSFRIVEGAPHLAEETTLRVYTELARKAPDLNQNIVLTAWLRERTCKTAVSILRDEDRPIDWAAVKKEKKAPLPSTGSQPAPPGLIIRICQSIFLTSARHRSPRFFSSAVWWPDWMRPRQSGTVAVCLLILILWWINPFHHHNPIIRSQETHRTPSSFAQLASPEEGGPPIPAQLANINAETNLTEK